jgi:predicted HicB family RNase H-like nuclease
MENKNRRLDLRVTEDLKKSITQEAKKQGISRNALIDKILLEYLNKYNKPV